MKIKGDVEVCGASSRKKKGKQWPEKKILLSAQRGGRNRGRDHTSLKGQSIRSERRGVLCIRGKEIVWTKEERSAIA